MSGLHPDSYRGQRVFHTTAARTINVELYRSKRDTQHRGKRDTQHPQSKLSYALSDVFFVGV